MLWKTPCAALLLTSLLYAHNQSAHKGRRRCRYGAGQDFTACQDDELLFRTRYRNINQLFVVFQPIVGTLVCLVGNAEGKQDNVFFIALKGMDCTAGYIGIAVFTQAFVDKLALIGKRRDNSNFLPRFWPI